MDDYELPPEPIKLLDTLEQSQIVKAHALLEQIVRVGQSSRALVVLREVNRTGPTSEELGWALATFGTIFVLTHWWIALPVAGVVALWRTQRRALKLRKSVKKRPYSLPDAVEFQNLWAVHCWKFVPMARGFNLRAQATNRLIRDGKKLDSARKMSELLMSFRDQLAYAHHLLYELRPYKSAKDPSPINLEVNHAVNDRLTLIDPLGLAAGSVDLDWLALETEHIHPDRFDDVLERDLAMAVDAKEEIDGSTTEAIFAALKRKLDG